MLSCREVRPEPLCPFSSPLLLALHTKTGADPRRSETASSAADRVSQPEPGSASRLTSGSDTYKHEILFKGLCHKMVHL